MAVDLPVCSNFIGNLRIGDWRMSDFISMDDLEYFLDQVIAEERAWDK